MHEQGQYPEYGEGHGFDDGRLEFMSDGGPSDVTKQAADTINDGLASLFLTLGPPPPISEDAHAQPPQAPASE